MKAEIDTLNQALEQLYEALDDPYMTTGEKIHVLASIEEIESEINELIGNWSQAESEYFKHE